MAQIEQLQTPIQGSCVAIKGRRNPSAAVCLLEERRHDRPIVAGPERVVAQETDKRSVSLDQDGAVPGMIFQFSEDRSLCEEGRRLPTGAPVR